jgi:Glyoxalase-like domain
MPIALDHVFVCCEQGGPEANALLHIGLIEGTRNVHPGQGTANRRFFFDGGFIELLWVHNRAEAQSKLSSRTKLWERWSQRVKGACPFGLAFSPTGSQVPIPPFDAWAYRPQYLPIEKSIMFATGTSLKEPELFYLAWASPQASSAAQPKNQGNPFLRMHSVSVGIPKLASLSEAAHKASEAGLVEFYEATKHELTLNFAARENVYIDLRSTLGLILRGSYESEA